MERQNIQADELNVRIDTDQIAMLHMIGEGAPDFSRHTSYRSEQTKEQGFDEHELPRDYQ